MKKEVIKIGIIIIVIVTVCFIGCLSPPAEQRNLDERLLGTWIGLTEGDDDSYNITYYFDNKGYLEITNQSNNYPEIKTESSYEYNAKVTSTNRLTYWTTEKPNYKYIWTYEFLNDDNTTINLYNLETSIILTKQ